MVKGTTRIEKFKVDKLHKLCNTTDRQSVQYGDPLLGVLGLGLLVFVQHWFFPTSLSWSSWTVARSAVLIVLAAAGFIALQYTRNAAREVPPYEYLSDHFGISTSFSAELTYSWQVAYSCNPYGQPLLQL